MFRLPADTNHVSTVRTCGVRTLSGIYGLALIYVMLATNPGWILG